MKATNVHFNVCDECYIGDWYHTPQFDTVDYEELAVCILDYMIDNGLVYFDEVEIKED